MPILGIGLHILVAIYFAIHALRTGRQMYWLLVLFSFPLLGSIVYFFVEYWPEMRNSRAIHQTGRTVRKLLDPGRSLRESQQAVELSPSADNRIRYANALHDAGRLDEAITQYREAAIGPHEFDPNLNLGLAFTLHENNRAVEARSVIERYTQHEPRRVPGDMQLLYARVLASCGDQVAARSQFERVIQEDSSAEARCLYGSFLVSIGEQVKAREVFNTLLSDAKHWPSHAQKQNREWLAIARSQM